MCTSTRADVLEASAPVVILAWLTLAIDSYGLADAVSTELHRPSAHPIVRLTALMAQRCGHAEGYVCYASPLVCVCLVIDTEGVCRTLPASLDTAVLSVHPTSRYVDMCCDLCLCVSYCTAYVRDGLLLVVRPGGSVERK